MSFLTRKRFDSIQSGGNQIRKKNMSLVIFLFLIWLPLIELNQKFKTFFIDDDEKDIAAYIKNEFDKKHNPTWHCIVGRNSGSYVTHETRHFM